MKMRILLGFDWKKLMSCAGIAALTLIFSQCSGHKMRGETLYLDSNQTGRAASRAQAAQLLKKDTESYWHGDGVSGAPRIVMSISKQKAWFYKGNQLVGLSLISSGDEEHPTPTGHFSVLQKDRAHRSSQYGDYLDKDGNVVRAEVDRHVDPMPAGAHYEGVLMPYFMRFSDGKGMHTGYLPGYPASHGCVRMPEEMARIFFENITEGAPVEIQP